jgi:hypothetical protein
MSTRFKAEFVYTQNVDELIVVGFADKQFETKEYVLLQRSLFATEQDKQFGFDNVHITFFDQARFRYRGIQLINLNKDSLEIHLKEDMAIELNTKSSIKIDISQASFDFDKVSEKLELLCNGFTEFSNN